MEDLGNPGWDPLCFVDDEGFRYWFPAMVRLALDSSGDYIDQFLFHLNYRAAYRELGPALNPDQHLLIRDVLHFLLDDRVESVELTHSGDDLISAIEIWDKFARSYEQ